MSEQTQESNRLIAEFMEAIEAPHPYKSFFPNIIGYEFPNGFPKPETGPHWWNLDSLAFHTSWEWLMPVVDKIELLTNESGVRFQVAIKSKYVYNTDSKQMDFIYSCGIVKNQYRFIYEMGYTKMEAVYKSVTQFIQWYKTQHP